MSTLKFPKPASNLESFGRHALLRARGLIAAAVMMGCSPLDDAVVNELEARLDAGVADVRPSTDAPSDRSDAANPGDVVMNDGGVDVSTDNPVQVDVPMGGDASDVVMMAEVGPDAADVVIAPDRVVPTDSGDDAVDVLMPDVVTSPCMAAGTLLVNQGRPIITTTDRTRVPLFVPTRGACSPTSLGLAGAPGMVRVQYGTSDLSVALRDIAYAPSGTSEGFSGTFNVQTMPAPTTAVVVSSLVNGALVTATQPVDLLPPVVTAFTPGSLVGGCPLTTFTTDTPSFYSIDVTDSDMAGASVLFHAFDPSYPPSMRFDCMLNVGSGVDSCIARGPLVGRDGLSRALRCTPVANTATTFNSLCDFDDRTNPTATAVMGRVSRRMNTADCAYLSQRLAGMLPSHGPTPRNIAIKVAVTDLSGNVATVSSPLTF